MKNIQISVRHYFDVEDIKNLLDSASRGSEYWCENELGYESETTKALSGNSSKTISGHMEHSKVIETEHESETEIVHFLDLKKIKKGLRIFAKKYPSHFADFVSEDYDMNTGDVFLQCCILGEVIYG